MVCTREQAIRVLQDHPEIDGSLRHYIDAVIEDRLPSYYLTQITYLRDDYVDDLPSTDVRSLISEGDNLTRYKCQTNFLSGLALTLRGAVKDGIVSDQQIQQDIETFITGDLNFQVGDMRNGERISKINQVLDITIDYLRHRT